MKGIVIFSSTGSVVFHTAPYSREVVDHVVAVVESDVHVKSTFEAAASAAPSTGSSSNISAQGTGSHTAFVNSFLRDRKSVV